MIIGVKGLTYAAYASGGEGAAVVYSGGVQVADMMVRVDQNEEREDASFNADDHRIDRDNSINGASLSIEVAQLTTGMREGMLGHTGSGTGTTVYSVTDAASPFVGVGFVLCQRYKGTMTYRAYWYHKVQFSEGQRSFNTKGENLEFQTESLEGEAVAVQLASAGAFEYYQYSEHTTDAAALAWVKGKAGIT